MEKIERRKAEEIFNAFYNKHLELYILSLINIKIFSSLSDNEQVGEEAGPQIGNQQTKYKITAKDAVERELKTAEKQKEVLEAIKQVQGDFSQPL